MVLYHGSRQIVEYPEIRKAKFNKDFYIVFYRIFTCFSHLADSRISRFA